MIRVVIMCQGQQSRLADLKIPKQLLPLPLCNTTILERTIKMLAAHDQVGEIVVIGGNAIAAAIVPDQYVETYSYSLARWADAPPAQGDAVRRTGSYRRAIAPVNLDVITLERPGNSVVRGLQAIRAYLRQEALATPGELGAGEEILFDRTVILLGDVVYSRRCLNALVPKVADPPIWFAVSPDLSPSGGEVYGLSYDAAGTTEFLSILDNVTHPPFVDTYQPGQLRRLLWERQRRDLEAEIASREVAPGVADIARAETGKPWDSCCTILRADFTRDIDTVEDMRRLGDLDVLAYYDAGGGPDGGGDWATPPWVNDMVRKA